MVQGYFRGYRSWLRTSRTASQAVIWLCSDAMFSLSWISDPQKVKGPLCEDGDPQTCRASPVPPQGDRTLREKRSPPARLSAPHSTNPHFNNTPLSSAGGYNPEWTSAQSVVAPAQPALNSDGYPHPGRTQTLQFKRKSQRGDTEQN